MTEKSFLWDNNATGDASPHSEADTAKLFEAIMGQSSANKGIVPGMLNELAPSISGTNILMNTGFAIVDGHPYYNNASLSTAITTPSVGTTGRRLVLRCSWASQTVRATIITSGDGTATIPAMTQTPGTTYDVPIASFTTTTGGVSTITSDDREMASAGGVDRQTFSGSGTWTRKGTSGYALVRMWAGGGRGGGGRGDAAGTDRGGGAGGGGGAYAERLIPMALLAATESVTIGAGGTSGGTGGTSGNGVAGGDGGNTAFGGWVSARGGKGGAGGTTTTAASGAGGGSRLDHDATVTNQYGNKSGASASSASGSVGIEGGSSGGGGHFNQSPGFSAGKSMYGGGGGGGGAGIPVANTEIVGGAGGSSGDLGATPYLGGGGAGGAVNGGAGAVGASGAVADTGGAGGGGGGSQDSGAGGAGAAGGLRGGAGGGGGAGTPTGGAGGNGGDGYCEVITFF